MGKLEAVEEELIENEEADTPVLDSNEEPKFNKVNGGGIP